MTNEFLSAIGFFGVLVIGFIALILFIAMCYFSGIETAIKAFGALVFVGLVGLVMVLILHKASPYLVFSTDVTFILTTFETSLT